MPEVKMRPFLTVAAVLGLLALASQPAFAQFYRGAQWSTRVWAICIGIASTGQYNNASRTSSPVPGQSNSGCRASMRRTDTYKRKITQQLGAGPAKRRISHHRHAVPLAPREQVTLNAPVPDTVRELISRTAIALWNTKEVFHVADLEIGDTPRAKLSR